MDPIKIIKELKYKNTKIYPIEKDQKKLINFYDECNIFILPSFTEGHPMALLEALSRLRPVIIFKDIEHIIGEKKEYLQLKETKKVF